jgi:predicted Rossmann fold nucleotide-binding protein DprA/Smf involved in DNA uptake
MSKDMMDKEALKALRAERQEWIAAASARVREDSKALKAVRARLGEGPATVPEVAQAAGLPVDRTLWFIATLRKFGEVVEGEKDGAYYRYALAAKAPEDANG